MYALQNLSVHADPQALGENGVLVRYGVLLRDELWACAGEVLSEVGRLRSRVRRHGASLALVVALRCTSIVGTR